MSDGYEVMSVFCMHHELPINPDVVVYFGYVLYVTIPCCPPDSPTCHHFLSVLGRPGPVRVDSDVPFTHFSQFNIFSYQWLTYYPLRVQEVVSHG